MMMFCNVFLKGYLHFLKSKPSFLSSRSTTCVCRFGVLWSLFPLTHNALLLPETTRGELWEMY